MKKWILIAAIAGLTAWWFRQAHAPADWTGAAAPDAPRQSPDNLPPPWNHGEYSITPLARFSVRAVVLSRCNYSGGHDGEVAPADFALGWGPASEAALINRIDVSQDMRWFMVSWRSDLPVPAPEVMRSCANMHLIPANAEVAHTLSGVRRHEVLEASGYLIEARHPDGWFWRSSLTRTDTGSGSCEVMWVEAANSLRPGSH